jgi:predicted ATPase
VQDPGVACRSFAAFTLWFLGYPDRALEKIQEALALAQERSHLHSLAFARSYAAAAHNLRHEGAFAQAQTEPLITLCTEQGFPFWSAWGTIMHGWVLAEQEQIEEGIAKIRNGLDALQLTGAEMWRPWFLTILAVVYEKAGQTEAGLTALTEALSMAEKNGERLREAELYRLRGELTLQQERQKSKSKNQKANIPKPKSHAEGEAEGYFLKAVGVARKQQAKSLELRAVRSLVRLRQQQATQLVSRITQHEAHARLDEAHKMLAEVYGWFTEGFDTKDLQEAKALLEELSY